MAYSSEDKVDKFFNTPDTSGHFDPKDIEQNKVMAVLAYFGILVVVPLVAAWKSPFARYHANQGVLMLFVWAGWGCIHGVSMSMLRALLLPDGWRLLAIINAILTLVYAAILVLTIAGIVNAVNGKAKEVPIVGRFRLLK